MGAAEVVVEDVGVTSISVSWGISRAVDALGYRLRVVHVDSAETVHSADNLGRGITEYTITDLEPGYLYEIIVGVIGSTETDSARVRTGECACGN